MAAEVVGTAFVRIRALTTGLAKDIERGMKQGAKDADVDSSGALVGDKFAKSAGAKIKSGIEGSVSDTTKNIDKKVDVDGGRKAGDRLGEAIKGGLSSVFDKAGDKLGDLFGMNESSGKKAGTKFGLGASRGMRGPLLKIGLLFAPAILGAGSLLLQYVVALTAQIGLLVQATAGAGIALGGVFGAMALAVGPLILAFKTETPRLKRFQDQATKVGKAWKEVGAATQETLLPGLTDALKLTTKLIPIFRGWGREVGRVVGSHAEFLAAILASNEGQRRLREITQGSVGILERLGSIAIRMGDILSRIWVNAIPIAQRFVDVIDDMVARWQTLIAGADESGRLSAVFDDWWFKAHLVGSTLADLFAAIWNIIQVGGNSAVPFFDNFAQWAYDFRLWTESLAGQNKLKQIFDDSLEVAHVFNDLLVEIGDRIGTAIFEPGGNEGIVGFLNVLKDDIVPFLDTFIRDLTGKYGDSLSEFFTTFGEFLTVLAEGEAINVTLTTLTLTFQALTETLETLMKIPGFDQFLGFLLGLASAFAILKQLGIVFIVGKIASGLLALGGALGGLAVTLGGLFGATGLGALAIGFGLIIAVVAAVAGAVALLVIHWDTLKEAFNAVTRFLKDPMKRLERLGELLSDLGNWLKEKLEDAVGAAGRALAGLGRAIGRALSKLPGIIGEALSDLGGAAVDAMASLGGAILDGITSALSALPGILRQIAVTAIQVFINALFLMIFGIPILITKGLIFLGPKVGAALADGFGVAVRFLTETLPRIFSAVVDWFQKLPGRLAGALGALGRSIAGVFTSAWRSLTDWLTNTAAPAVLDFFKKLPGRIVGALSALRDNVVRMFRDAMDAGKRIVSGAIDGIVDFFRKLPGRILGFLETIKNAAIDIGESVLNGIVDALGGGLEFAKDVGNAVKNAVKDAINSLIDFLNDAIPNKLGKWPVEINIPDNPIPRLSAMGGIFRKATNTIVGEAGDEVIIPLTRPQRALELFNQSGLAAVLDRARRGNNGSSTPALAATGGRDLTVIQHFHEKQDPKLMAVELAWELP